MPDLYIRKGSSNKSYMYFELEDMYVTNVPPLSGISLVTSPTLDTADDDIAYFIATEHRVAVEYPWYPSDYRDEWGDLPEKWYEWFDDEDDDTWPWTSCIKYYEDGKLIDEWVWSE